MDLRNSGIRIIGYTKDFIVLEGIICGLRKFWDTNDSLYEGQQGLREVYCVDLTKFWNKNDWLYEDSMCLIGLLCGFELSLE